MKPDMFRKPVTILVGLDFPAEVRTVMDAYRHLVEWPASMRDTTYSVALKACGAALRSEIEAETARGLFAAFAEKHDLLAPEVDAIAAAHVGRDRDPHIRLGVARCTIFSTRLRAVP
ncbi:hypothetical protein SRABI05_00353 [Agrobacterium fabrum]|uniref:DUF982 domain-containing protein n=1 Tax=Agrobacterium fabrum TaxID=1176649 RepID=UPI001D95B692|nr:hypothetical protein SRABI05_00353 [Agrobacterium fabrum]CAH0162862.1 hypothetical protein SRABI46_01067 [Agrobacterium fabrum]